MSDSTVREKYVYCSTHAEINYYCLIQQMVSIINNTKKKKISDVSIRPGTLEYKECSLTI